MALVLPFNDQTCETILPQVQRVLAASGVIAIPTETSYGLAVRPTETEALRRLFEIKGRLPDKPILVLIGNHGQLDQLVARVPPAAAVLMKQLWPGPLTIVFPAAADLPSLLTAGTGTVGIRLSPLPHLRRLLSQTGPVTGTSANRSSEPSLNSAADVEQALGSALDMILDGGPTAGGLASTIVDACGRPRLLRPGALSTDVIRVALSSQGYALSL
jgi:L-threonylcarbamoyladenylate synthase